MRFPLLLATLALPLSVFAASKNYDVKVDGMTCASCAQTVTAALAKIPGVDAASVKVVLKKKDATFTVADDKADLTEQIKKAVEDAGYSVSMINGKPVAAAAKN